MRRRSALRAYSIAEPSSSVGSYEFPWAYDENTLKRLQLSEVSIAGNHTFGVGLQGALQDAIVRFILSDKVDRLSGTDELHELPNGGAGPADVRGGPQEFSEQNLFDLFEDRTGNEKLEYADPPKPQDLFGCAAEVEGGDIHICVGYHPH